jgi:hypothetical protein
MRTHKTHALALLPPRDDPTHPPLHFRTNTRAVRGHPPPPGCDAVVRRCKDQAEYQRRCHSNGPQNADGGALGRVLQVAPVEEVGTKLKGTQFATRGHVANQHNTQPSASAEPGPTSQLRTDPTIHTHTQPRTTKPMLPRVLCSLSTLLKAKNAAGKPKVDGRRWARVPRNMTPV